MRIVSLKNTVKFDDAFVSFDVLECPGVDIYATEMGANGLQVSA